MSDLYCPLLSIVVPVYNVGGYLLDTLDSIAVQSYNNIEVIVLMTDLLMVRASCSTCMLLAIPDSSSIMK